jgi:hypothetical protein
MVIGLLSPAARLSAASPFTERTSRAAKEAKLPAAARNQKGPELSAREASTSPAANSAGLVPLIALPACLTLPSPTHAMLSPTSDKTRRREQPGAEKDAWRCAA